MSVASAKPEPATGAVLVVDDHASARQSIAEVLRLAGHEVHACASAVEALGHRAGAPADVVVTDLQMPGMTGLEFIDRLTRGERPPQTVMITAHASVDTAVEAMRRGAFDYLEKPFDALRLEHSVDRALKRARLVAGGFGETPTMLGESPAMLNLRQQIARVAATDETVLILGESGAGKELVAQSIHAQSRRASGPMVGLNCPVLSEQLTESELFGHRRGAFTGADSDRVGRFEQASGGTILLDEITEINPHLQAKLLRVLQERLFERVGDSEPRELDARVVAATNRDLHHRVQAGEFREDLYFRLAVLPVAVPPLRARGEDVLLLAGHFLLQAETRIGRSCVLAEDARQLLREYPWPGNVRELQNIITRACVLTTAEEIPADLIKPWLSPNAAADDASPSPQPELPAKLAEVERQAILTALQRFNGHRQKTAESLGIGVRTLSGKLRAYGFAPGETFGKAA
ncbi:MAG: sigma-54 dependent transcriptional regulator [Planctomycetota bacterium]